MSRLVVFSVALVACLGCASRPEPASPFAQQTQPIQVAPPSHRPAPSPPSHTGTYALDLMGNDELVAQRLILVLRRSEEGDLTAHCRTGRWDLSGSVEGGDRPGSGEPLAMALVGLSPLDEAPIALRLIADPSGETEALRGTAIVERAGVATTMPFVARRRGPAERQPARCGELMWSTETRYQGPGRAESVTTRRFEGCVEIAPTPAAEPDGEGD